jgi:hypothetical protein
LWRRALADLSFAAAETGAAFGPFSQNVTYTITVTR